MPSKFKRVLGTLGPPTERHPTECVIPTECELFLLRASQFIIIIFL